MLKENIRHLLKSNNITQKKCSIYLGISIKTLEAKLRGYRPFKIDEVTKIKDLLNVEYSDLLN